MGTIENLTKTHVALDVQLDRFHRLLQAVADGEDDIEVERLTDEAHTILRRLERHFANESTLEEESDDILGPGSMQDYSVGEHQKSLRDTAELLCVTAVAPEPDFDELVAQFEQFVERFAAYTRAEWDFIQANAAIIFPGGRVD